MADVWYPTNGQSWTQAHASAPWGRRGDHTSVVFRDALWVIGGDGATVENDVWFSPYAFRGDYDGDGLLDQWETMDLDTGTPGVQNPFDPYNPDVMGDNFDLNPDGIPDGRNDWDGDGMSNADEFTFGFNPTDAASFGEMPLRAWPLGVVLLALGVRTARRRLRVLP